MSVTRAPLPPYLGDPQPPVGRGGPRGRLRWRLSHARYELRLLPIGAFCGSALLGVAWAVGSHIDSGTERTFLVVMSTLALSLVFVDVVGGVSVPVPVPVRSRRAPVAVIAVAIAALGWIVARVGVPAARGGDLPVTVADVVEWCTIALSQLTVACLMARRAGEASVGPGLVVAMVWVSATSNPRVHGSLYDVSQHPVTWAALAVLFGVVCSFASADPAHRRIRMW